MEATLQRIKPKKERSKSKHSSSVVSSVGEVKQSSDNSNKIRKEEKCLDDNLKIEGPVHMHSTENKLQESITQKLSVNSECERNFDNCSKDIHENVLPISNSIELNKLSKICDNDDSNEATQLSIKHIDNAYNSIEIKNNDVECSTDQLSSEKLPLKLKPEIDAIEINLQPMYPDLKSLQHCEQMHNIAISQTLVKTYVDKYQQKIRIEANNECLEFMKGLHDLDKHPLVEMIHQYQKAKKSSSQLRSRIKYLKSDLKRKKDSLWRSVKKEASAKGKCQDGYSVNIKHIFTIKELDEIKFNEVKKILNEIEQLLLSDAFHSYSEELMKLRIEHYIYNLIEKEKHIGNQKSVSGFNTASGMEPESLKKCISVLFDSQRQNVQDKHFLKTCQKWLKTLVSKLKQDKNFKDNLFLINHVIRCPNGIKNWASELVQVPIDDCETERSEIFECICAERVLLALFFILCPAPYKESFLKHIKVTALTDCVDRNFTILDSEGEEEEMHEISKNWSDADILSLLNQIPIRSLFRHFLLDTENNSELEIKMQSQDRMLKHFAYTTATIDILCMGLEAYCLENFPSLFGNICNLIRHTLLYISEYYVHQMNMNNLFKSQLQAVYDKLFFHVVFKIYNFEKLHVWKILPALPYNHVSGKMLWNILWIFFCPGRSEEQIYSEKDVEMKIKDESVQSYLLSHIKNLPIEDILQLLNAFEKIIVTSNGEEDFIKFTYYLIFKITIIESSLRDKLCNDGSIILASVCKTYPSLISVLLKEIDENDDIADLSINLFRKINLINWIPADSDINFVSSWLLSNLAGEKNYLARLILKKMNFEFSQEGLLFLPYDLHRKIALCVTEAYLMFDANNCNEGLISKGVKQMLQFMSIGTYQREVEREFPHWAWNILFSLKLHPLDRKHPPWIEVYDGYVEEFDNVDLAMDCFKSLLSAYENKHPAGCYLMLAMTSEGYSLKNLLNNGLECLSSLVGNEQYMAAIKSLYYILPFFVKNSEQLLEKFGFIKAMNDLITADMTFMANITGEPVTGSVLLGLVAMMKHQIYQAGEHTIEYAAPLIKLYIKIFMKMLSPSDQNSANILKNSAKQIYFLLDFLVKISFLHDYTRNCALDLLSSYCVSSLLPKTSHSSLWKKLFPPNFSKFAILNRNTIPEYPWLAWYVLFSEMRQKNVQDLWLKVQVEMMKQNDESSPGLKRILSDMKIDYEFLPIYRWALQVVETPASHPVSPLIWQQFFKYYLQRVQLPNSESHVKSIGMKYFKNESLRKKIQNHLVDAENFYKKKLLNMPGQSSENSKSNVCENGYLFNLNLLKLFQAFQLWFDDESLQNPQLCLSALEPKYCPHRLDLILKGDQHVWLDMVSVSSLKDEIDQKVHSQYFEKNQNHANHEPQLLIKEPLSEHIITQLEKYETILPVVNTEPVCVTACDVNNSATSSKEAIVQLIEQNQCIIFDKAKYFCEQMNKLKQLNFNFINLTPQEFEVEDCEVNEMKVCYKGNGCSGGAHFKLQIQRYKRMERISERIDNNRADYLIVHDQLSKLPVKDLCIASLHIENLIRSLAEKMREDKFENADYFRKMGIALFYHQISTINETLTSVADYPPSRQFYSLIIESLGEEFIDGDEAELTKLAKSILNHPESGALALPLFNPNKSSISNFQSVYGTLTSSVTKEFANTLLALFSKIDFSQWLNQNGPNFDDRKKLFNNICDALLICGFNPEPELLPVFDILKRHFGIILKYMFPDLFPDAVSFILNGIEDQNLSIDICYEAFHSFGIPLFNDKASINNIEHSLRKFAQNQHLSADQQIFISVAQLNLYQVKQVCLHLNSHFIQKRLNCILYKRYKSYIKPLGIFLAIVSHSLIALQLDEISSSKQTLCLSDLWDIFHLPFTPFLHPVVHCSGLDFPWSDEELSEACYMFKIFTICLKYFHEKILSHGCEESILSYLWNFYIEIYVVPNYRHHAVSLCHTELLELPWHQFYPSSQDIEGMCKVLQSNLHESIQFLSKISSKIPWCEVMQAISITKPPHYVGKVLATLGKLLIIFQLHCSETETDVCPVVFKEFESLSWHFLSIEDIEILLNLFYSNLDPILLLNNFHNQPEFYILQFLKLICCMIPNADPGEYSNSKRILYLQKFKSSLSACCNSKKAETQKSVHKLKVIFTDLLDEINDICNGFNPSEQANYALPLMKEIITFLNEISEGEIDADVVNSIISWLSSNKKSPLLLPCLKVSSCDLHSVTHRVALIECCISTCFIDDVVDLHETQSKWQLISSFFYVPPKILEDFVKKCVQENAYLTLYCYVLHLLPRSASTENKKQLLERIVQWVRSSKLSSDAEAKFLLLLDKLLELSIKLVLLEEFQVVKQELTSLCWMLETLAEDRSSSGFFAAIGFGEASSLSVKFLCRVMTAFILFQIPDNCPIRMEPMDIGHSASISIRGNVKGSKSSNEPLTSISALKALDNLKALHEKKLYSALQSQIDYAVKCISDPKYSLIQIREFLKYFAIALYPKDSYLASLDS